MMKLIQVILYLTLLGMTINAQSGDGSDISMSILVDGQTNHLVIMPGDEIRVNFIASNKGPNEVDFLFGGTVNLVQNFSFPFDIDCQDLVIGQAREFDPTDYAIGWRISPLSVGETNDCEFSLRALPSTSDDEQIQIRFLPTSFSDPNPSNNIGSFLIEFDHQQFDSIAIPAQSIVSLSILVLLLLFIGLNAIRTFNS